MIRYIVVAMLEERIQRFAVGLRPRIRKHVLSVHLTFDENMKKAFCFEDIKRKIRVDKSTDRVGELARAFPSTTAAAKVATRPNDLVAAGHLYLLREIRPH